MYRWYNPNTCGKEVGDCVIRAVSKGLNQDWQETYIDICILGLKMCDMPSSNSVWGKYLTDKGFFRKLTDFETVEQFCEKHPKGIYILATGSHVIAVIDGDYYDAWDSGKERITYYFEKGE